MNVLHTHIRRSDANWTIFDGKFCVPYVGLEGIVIGRVFSGESGSNQKKS
jgi:hypothetical protein